MNHRFSSAVLFVVASLAAFSVHADGIVLSDVGLTARATFSSQRVTPEKSDFDSKIVPPDQLLQVAQALVVDGFPFPNLPNSQDAGFASSAATVGGVFGVGVNGFHFENSLPPNRYFASGRWTQTLTNSSTVTQVSNAIISVPAPTIRFFGVGDSFPAGADPLLDATASVDIRLTSKLTHADGSVVETVLFDYGMQTLRAPVVGVLLADPSNDALANLSRFDEPDGSFGFRLLPVVKEFSFGGVRPGESLEFGYDYFATASTGFGETGLFAAIGDPFDLSTGGRLQFQVTAIPELGTLALMAVGLATLSALRHKAGRRSRSRSSRETGGARAARGTRARAWRQSAALEAPRHNGACLCPALPTPSARPLRPTCRLWSA